MVLMRLWALLPVSELPVLEKPVVLLAGAKESVVNAPVFGVVLPIAEGLAKSTLAPPPSKKGMVSGPPGREEKIGDRR